jgi:hypothetical protein
MPAQRESQNTTRFLALTALISSLFYAPIISTGHVGGGAGLDVTGLTWSSAVAAFVTVYFRHPDVRSLGLAWGVGSCRSTERFEGQSKASEESRKSGTIDPVLSNPKPRRDWQ